PSHTNILYPAPYGARHHRAPPSSPTRRSSDLDRNGPRRRTSPHRPLVPPCRPRRGLLYRSRPWSAHSVGEGSRLPQVGSRFPLRSEEHTSLQSRENLVCRLLLEKKNAALDSLY